MAQDNHAMERKLSGLLAECDRAINGNPVALERFSGLSLANIQARRVAIESNLACIRERIAADRQPPVVDLA